MKTVLIVSSSCLRRVVVVSWRELSERCPLCSTTILSLYSTMKNHRLRETVSDVTTTFWERSNYNLMSVPSSAADVEQMARSLKPRPLFMIRLCPTFCAARCRSVIAKYACLAHTLWTLVKCGANSRINGFTVHSSTWLIVSSSRVSGTEFYILRSEAKMTDKLHFFGFFRLQCFKLTNIV